MAGLFSGLEGNLEKYIEGFFKDKFRGKVQPVEIAKKLAREMRDRKRVSVNHVYVPNEYIVHLSSGDWEAVSSIASKLSVELQDYLVEKAEEKNFTMVASPLVSFNEDNALGKGHLRVEGRFASAGRLRDINATDNNPDAISSCAPDEFEDTLNYNPARDTAPVPVVPTGIRACLVVNAGPQEGRVIELEPHPMIIGRRETCDIVLADSSVSRRHVRLEYRQGSFIITDLDSTNGTFVNGIRVKKKLLQPGDTIKIGSSLCEFKVE